MFNPDGSLNKFYKKDEAKAKPDFLDLDKDGDKKEPMKKAAKDKEEMEESPELKSFKELINQII